ncbi:hypothetical protein AAC387_Pa07g0480 [Persea americana]
MSNAQTSLSNCLYQSFSEVLLAVTRAIRTQGHRQVVKCIFYYLRGITSLMFGYQDFDLWSSGLLRFKSSNTIWTKEGILGNFFLSTSAPGGMGGGIRFMVTNLQHIS